MAPLILKNEMIPGNQEGKGTRLKVAEDAENIVSYRIMPLFMFSWHASLYAN